MSSVQRHDMTFAPENEGQHVMGDGDILYPLIACRDIRQASFMIMINDDDTAVNGGASGQRQHQDARWRLIC
eukprot:scaffold79959_cov36-Cyclotella_meneghiniana.AAC.1